MELIADGAGFGLEMQGLFTCVDTYLVTLSLISVLRIWRYNFYIDGGTTFERFLWKEVISEVRKCEVLGLVPTRQADLLGSNDISESTPQLHVPLKINHSNHVH